MDRFYTPRSFHRVQEHPKRTSDEEVMVVRSWRTQPENPVHRTSRGLLFSVIFGHNLGLSCINIYMGGFYTQRAFHRVQEHPKQTLDEEVMAVRSWRIQSENLLEGTVPPGLLHTMLAATLWINF